MPCGDTAVKVVGILFGFMFLKQSMGNKLFLKSLQITCTLESPWKEYDRL